eukprot:scaffold2215_cov125-Skeletonema_marinoi.AAC.5
MGEFDGKENAVLVMHSRDERRLTNRISGMLLTAGLFFGACKFSTSVSSSSSSVVIVSADDDIVELMLRKSSKSIRLNCHNLNSQFRWSKDVRQQQPRPLTLSKLLQWSQPPHFYRCRCDAILARCMRRTANRWNLESAKSSSRNATYPTTTMPTAANKPDPLGIAAIDEPWVHLTTQ